MKSFNFVFIVILLFVVIMFYNNSNQFDLSPKQAICTVSPYGDDFKPVAVVAKENSPFEFNLLQFSSSEDYGVTKDGTFFINASSFQEFSNFVLVLLPEETMHTEKRVRETYEKESYQMLKAGDYYFAKPEKVGSQPLYYFQSGHICLPTFKMEKFSYSSLLRNDFGGYVIKGR
jgi:hypothetical protein